MRSPGLYLYPSADDPWLFVETAGYFRAGYKMPCAWSLLERIRAHRVGLSIRWADLEAAYNGRVPAEVVSIVAETLAEALSAAERAYNLEAGVLPDDAADLDFIRRYDDPVFLTDLNMLIEVIR